MVISTDSGPVLICQAVEDRGYCINITNIL